jgi:SAM-dependent methyltransferase
MFSEIGALVSGMDHEGYFHYLLHRSRLGLLYRRNYLYPCLSRYLQGSVLDVGCGIGDFLHSRKQTIGVDVNPFTIDYCRKRGLEAHLINREAYPFSDMSFDGALMDNVLEHLSDPGPTLSEIHRILKPLGTLIVGVPGRRGYTNDYDHKRYYDEHSLTDCITRFGFNLIKIICMPFRSAWLDRHMPQYCTYGIFKRG